MILDFKNLPPLILVKYQKVNAKCNHWRIKIDKFSNDKYRIDVFKIDDLKKKKKTKKTQLLRDQKWN